MSLPLDGVREAVPREWSRFRSLLSAADAASWSTPTRLDGWTVRDLAVHVVWGISMEADALRRRRTGVAGRAEGRSVGEGADREGVLAALDEVRHELTDELAALSEQDLGSPAPLPYGDVPVAMFSQILVMEAGVHTDDLAAALGQDTVLPEDVIVATEVVLRVFLPILASSATDTPQPGTAVALRGPTASLTFRYGGAGWEVPEPGDPLAPAMTVEAEDAAVLLFALGRIPDTDPRLSFSGDALPTGRFKTWLPGP